MDALRLLTGSTSLQRKAQPKQEKLIPSAGTPTRPQLLAEISGHGEERGTKRKREHRSTDGPGAKVPDFFDLTHKVRSPSPEAAQEQLPRSPAEQPPDSKLSPEDYKSILKRHKLKISIIRENEPGRSSRRRTKRSSKRKEATGKDMKTTSIFPRPLQSFGELSSLYGVSRRMIGSLSNQGYSQPTEIQLAALPLLCDRSRGDGDIPGADDFHLLTIAPTGSGKTLAFLIPIINEILLERSSHSASGKADAQGYVEAVILAPTHELVDQIVNEGRKISAGTGVRVSAAQKGSVISQGSGNDTSPEPSMPCIKSSIVVGTPEMILKSIRKDASGVTQELSRLRNLVLDEADVLLDPLFREQTVGVWDSCSNPSLRVSLWSATIGSSVENFACDRLLSHKKEKKTRKEAPKKLVRIIAGLKDSAIPNVKHSIEYAANEQGKLMALRNLLHPSSASSSESAILPPFLVFTQTIKRAIALHSELLYDIPLEAGGSSRIAVLHSGLQTSTRADIMTRFRKGEIWVMITTDLLSRGIDFRGVNGVVNYDIATSSAIYVHRAGRTGRAGREGGICKTLYTKEDIPYMKNIANVIAAAEKMKGDGSPHNGCVMPDWLLDAFPNLSKETKKNLKEKGVMARRSGKAGTRISTKSGYERKLENRRKTSRQSRMPRNPNETPLGTSGNRSESEEEEFTGFGDD